MVRLGVDWAIGIEFCGGDTKFTVLNIYTPFESSANESEYLNRLAYVMACIQDNLSSRIFIVGDWNADLSDHRSTFASHLKHFCSDNGLFLSSELLLPNDSYTYTSEAWHTTSWLDHCICTSDAHNSIEDIRINYELTSFDHVPFSLCIRIGNTPSFMPASKLN